MLVHVCISQYVVMYFSWTFILLPLSQEMYHEHNSIILYNINMFSTILLVSLSERLNYYQKCKIKNHAVAK